MFIKNSSPSRQYVAMCKKADNTGYYFRQFTLAWDYEGEDNNTEEAAWFYVNVLAFDGHSPTIEGVITLEDYANLLNE